MSSQQATATENSDLPNTPVRGTPFEHIPGYQIGTLKIAPGLVLSPMSGVTHSAFRRLIQDCNPGALGLVISEFISVEGLTRDSKRSREMLFFHESERPVGIQIFGYDPQRMARAAAMVQECGADLVDINCGCPAPKVVKNGGGCELMRQPQHLRVILREVRRAVTIPLTLKMRSGWDEGSKNALEIATIAEGEGVQALAVHGRTRAQLYRGQADWDVVHTVAQAVKIPVAGSGDIVDLESAQTCLGALGTLEGTALSGETLQAGPRRTPVAGLFIGRAALRNPFVFGEILDQLAARSPPSAQPARPLQLAKNAVPPLRSPSKALERLLVMRHYSTLLRQQFSAEQSVGRLKQLTTQYARGSAWREELLRSNSFDAQLELLERAYAHEMELAGKSV
jgi:nifR3 family TIM-barrel protein